MRFRAFYADWSSAGIRREHDARRLIDLGRARFVLASTAPRDDLRSDTGASFLMGLDAEMVLLIDELPRDTETAIRQAIGAVRSGRRRDAIAHEMTVGELADRRNSLAIHARTGRPVDDRLPRMNWTSAERREAEAVAGGRLVAEPRGV